jgi:uncharacterized protein (TIGR02284 family)
MADLIEHLNGLIALDLDAIEAYDSCIARIDTVTVRERLREFQGDHHRHVRDLTEAVMRFGGAPRQRPDIKGFFIKNFTAVTSMMGDEASLRAMKSNEELTTKTYKKALAETYPSDVRALIEKNYADEQRHLAYIEECLRNRVWEATPKTI